jgi:hypothetical protein
VTQAIDWSYRGTGGKNRFYCPIMGVAQRLPNGNTFILDPAMFRLFEVTPEKKIVWEYGQTSTTTREPPPFNGSFTGARRYLAEQLPFVKHGQRPPI